MKGLFRNSFFIILILVSLITSSTIVTSVQAQGSGIQILPLGLPAGWVYGYLNGIWGSDANDVFAVGYAYNGSSLQPLLYHKDINGWTASNLLLPAGWTYGVLQAVWGSGPANVYAVGYAHNGNANAVRPIIYHWNGATWLVESPDIPLGWGTGNLYGVWGSGPNDIYAVGSGVNTVNSQPLMYHWDGITWNLSTPQLPLGWSSGTLYGAWGSGPNDVYIVGAGSGGLPLIYHWDGVALPPSVISLPVGWSSGNLKGIWGSAANNIYAVGAANNGTSNVPLLLLWDGGTWTTSSLTLPPGVASGYLSAIWGSAASDLYAVGYGYQGSTIVPLLYHRDSVAWDDASPTMPAGWNSDFLYGVWGSSFDDIYVVGSGHNGSVDMPLLYHTSQVGQDLLVPGDVTNLTATTGTSASSVDLSWTAPADDAGNNASGRVAAYLVKYSTIPFTSWTDGVPVSTGLPVPADPGMPQTMTVSGLNRGTVYYFAVRSQDEQYNLSTNYVTASATASAPPAVGAGIYDDTDINWVYSGNWANYNGGGPYNSTLHYTSTVGSAAELLFNGTKFTLLFTKDSNRGSIGVFVDNNPTPVTTIDAYAASLTFQQTYTSPTLTPGDHTVRLVHAGGRPYIDIDAIQIHGTPVAVPAGTYDDLNSNWVYSGNWATYNGGGPYNNTLHYTSTVGDFAELTFTGTQFTLLFTKDSNRGSIGVFVDNNPTPVTTIDAYAASLTFQQTYTSPSYPEGNHTVRLVHAGGRPYIDIDAIQIIGTPVPVLAGTYDDLNSNWVYSGNWATYIGGGPYNNSLRYTSTVGSYAELLFTGTKFTLIFTKDSNRGSIDVFIDNNPTPVTTIDTYAASLTFQQTYTSPTLTLGNHTVRLVHAGGQPYIDIDAIQIFGTPVTVPAGTYDDGHAAWNYSGIWASYNGAGPYNNTLHYTSTMGNAVELTFTGTKFTLTFTKDSNRGAIDVYVDGNPVTTLDAYAASLTFQQTYTSPTLTSGNHTVRLVHAGGRPYIDIDSITIQ